MTTFPKYERYKDSGVEWLGEIPEHWESEKGKWLFLKMDRQVRPDDGVVTAFRDGQVTLRTNRRTDGFTNAIKEHGYQGIRKGDLVIHAMDAFAGAIGVSESDGKSTPVYSACVPRKPNTVTPELYAYLLRYMAHSGFITTLAKGIRERSTDFRFNDFGALDLPLPPKPEQDRIVAFLDQKTAEIDALIAKKQRQIELLDEQKAILINRAVTRGLNPNAKLKPSGIEWIGEIPEHWEVSSIRRQASFVTSGSRGWAQYSSPSGPLFLRICNLSRGSLELRLEDIERVMPPRGSEGERTKVASGDVLISITAFIGSIGVVPDEFEEAYVSQHIALVRIKPSGTHPKWIGYSLLSELGAIQSNLMMYGGTKVGLSLGDVKNYCFPVPPQNEQVDIVEHIAAVFSGYTRGVSQFEKEIQSLKILRSTLIAHAVTGRIKV
jgi:type I restriction enzyme S subunit